MVKYKKLLQKLGTHNQAEDINKHEGSDIGRLTEHADKAKRWEKVSIIPSPHTHAPLPFFSSLSFHHPLHCSKLRTPTRST
jgi:hypothetical protein